MQWRKPPLPALTVKLSKYNVDDVALGVCKTGAEEAGVTEVRTSLSEKKFELWREIKDRKSGSAGMPRPTSYAVFCLKKKNCARRRRSRLLRHTGPGPYTGSPRRPPSRSRRLLNQR